MGCVLFLLVRNRSLLKVMILFCVAVGRHNDGWSNDGEHYSVYMMCGCRDWV